MPTYHKKGKIFQMIKLSSRMCYTYKISTLGNFITSTLIIWTQLNGSKTYQNFQPLAIHGIEWKSSTTIQGHNIAIHQKKKDGVHFLWKEMIEAKVGSSTKFVENLRLISQIEIRAATSK
jgi:hypothetical protein